MTRSAVFDVGAETVSDPRDALGDAAAAVDRALVARRSGLTGSPVATRPTTRSAKRTHRSAIQRRAPVHRAGPTARRCATCSMSLGATFGSPAWSPDGSTIAIVSDECRDGEQPPNCFGSTSLQTVDVGNGLRSVLAGNEPRGGAARLVTRWSADRIQRSRVASSSSIRMAGRPGEAARMAQRPLVA